MEANFLAMAVVVALTMGSLGTSMMRVVNTTAHLKASRPEARVKRGLEDKAGRSRDTETLFEIAGLVMEEVVMLVRVPDEEVELMKERGHNKEFEAGETNLPARGRRESQQASHGGSRLGTSSMGQREATIAILSP